MSQPTPLPHTTKAWTDEELIEFARRNGSLDIIAARIQGDAARVGEPVPDDARALAMAERIVLARGITTPDNLPRVVNEPGPSAGTWFRGCLSARMTASHTALAIGLNPRGRRTGVKAGSDSVRRPSATVNARRDGGPGRWYQPKRLRPGAPPEPREKLLRMKPRDLRQQEQQQEREAEESAARAAERRARRVLAGLEADGIGTDLQRRAYTLVRVQGRTYEEAGGELGGISKQAVFNLRKKLERAIAAKSATPAVGGEGLTDSGVVQPRVREGMPSAHSTSGVDENRNRPVTGKRDPTRGVDEVLLVPASV
jgi:hypothetical protein